MENLYVFTFSKEITDECPFWEITNIINELISYGKPILSSYISPMPSLLLNNAIYFNPVDELDVYKALEFFLSNDFKPGLACYHNDNFIEQLSWSSCAKRTFDFILSINND